MSFVILHHLKQFYKIDRFRENMIMLIDYYIICLRKILHHIFYIFSKSISFLSFKNMNIWKFCVFLSYFKFVNLIVLLIRLRNLSIFKLVFWWYLNSITYNEYWYCHKSWLFKQTRKTFIHNLSRWMAGYRTCCYYHRKQLWWNRHTSNFSNLLLLPKLLHYWSISFWRKIVYLYLFIDFYDINFWWNH